MAEIRKQCVLEVEDDVGQLAELTDRIQAAAINITAVCARAEQGVGRVMVVSDDHDKLYTAVSPFVDRCEFREVICVPIANRPGGLHGIASALADAGIRIELIYATAGEESEALVVVDTSDNRKAAEIL